MRGRDSILNLNEPADEARRDSALKRALDHWRESLNGWFGGRSAAWWIGAVAGIVCYGAVLLGIEAATDGVVRPGATALLALVGGGALGDRFGSRVQRFRERLSYDERRRTRLRRRMMLACGVALFVYNVLPDSRLNHLTEFQRDLYEWRLMQGQSNDELRGYYWSPLNALLAAVGAALASMAVVESRAKRF